MWGSAWEARRGHQIQIRNWVFEKETCIQHEESSKSKIERSNLGRRARCFEKQLHLARSSVLKWTNLKATRDWKLRTVGTKGCWTWNITQLERRTVAWNWQYFKMINPFFKRRIEWNRAKAWTQKHKRGRRKRLTWDQV